MNWLNAITGNGIGRWYAENMMMNECLWVYTYAKVNDCNIPVEYY